MSDRIKDAVSSYVVGQPKPISDYLTINPIAKTKSGETWHFAVNGEGGARLGEISWYAHWRRYTFKPMHGCILEWDACMPLRASCAPRRMRTTAL